MLWGVACLLLFSLVKADTVEDPDVLVLTDQNFDTLKDFDIALVEFYAPWCGHCKRLAPHFAKAATALKANDPPVILAKVDAEANRDLASRFEVTGYPTLKIFRNGVASDYEGPRETDGIVSYMKKQVGKSSTPITTIEDFHKATNTSLEDIIVVYYGPAAEATALKAFIAKADKLRSKYKFAHMTDEALIQEVSLPNKQGIVLFRHPETFKGDDLRIQFDHTLQDLSPLETFIKLHAIPSVSVLSMENYQFVKRSGKPLFYLFGDINERSPKQTTYLVNRLRKVAQAATNKSLHYTVVSRSLFSKEVGQFGETDYAIAAGQVRYVPENRNFTVDAAVAFAADFLDNKLTPYVKSQPIPVGDAEFEDGVRVVVGKSFNDIVNNATADVFIEFYAPWCGHCKKLAPIYAELAKKVHSLTNDVIIAKFDATANDAPSEVFPTKGYPSLYFAPRGAKDAPIPYQGDRTLRSMLSFLAKNAKSETAAAALNIPKKKKKTEAATINAPPAADKDEL